MWLETEWRVCYEVRSSYDYTQWNPVSFISHNEESKDDAVKVLKQLSAVRNVRVESRIVGPWIAPMEVSK